MKWHRRFLSMADLIASWSKDPSTKVGAVIVDSKRRIISTGYNGFPHRAQDTPVPREQKLLRTVHAEVNAIIFAQRSLENNTIYVTHHPCAQCAAKIAQTGISTVVCWTPTEEFYFRWLTDIEESQAILKESGVSLVLVDPYENQD